MTTFYTLLTYILLAFRFHLVAGLLHTTSLSAFILATLGFVAILTTVAALCVGKLDTTCRGFLVGLGHLAILTFKPESENHLAWIAPLFWILVALQTWAKWHLGRRCTVTGPVWVDLVATGPYGIVRHPMTLCELCLAITFALEWSSAWNTFALVFVLASKFAITLLEENFLMDNAEYRHYAKRVKWRFVPGLW